jgi:ribosomal protein S18 acetylase RimI-like enzyme
MNVAPAGPGDVETLVDLMQEFYAESAYPLDRAWAAASLRQLLGDPRLGGAWIARIDGVATGYLVVTLRHSMAHGAPEGFIDDLFVRPAARRRGVARMLLDALFDDCRSRGVASVKVEVGEDNAAANALYASFGMAGNDRLVLATAIAPHGRT